jgi:hypothetical protein
MPEDLSPPLVDERSGLEATGCVVGRSEGLEGALSRDGVDPRLLRVVLLAVIGKGGKAPFGGSARGRAESTGRDMLTAMLVIQLVPSRYLSSVHAGFKG